MLIKELFFIKINSKGIYTGSYNNIIDDKNFYKLKKKIFLKKNIFILFISNFEDLIITDISILREKLGYEFFFF